MKTRVPFLDLAAQAATLEPQLTRAVSRVLRSGRYVLAENVAAFERELARFCNARYAVGVANGTDALVLSLQALGIGAGDEVITTPFTFIASAEAIHRVGAKIVFADIDNSTLNIDPQEIAKKVSRRTRAILPVHLFGNPAPMKEILALSRRHKLLVVEDAAQAIGATIHGRSVGALGDAGILSFYPTKNLGGVGDGGAVLTNSRVIAEKIRLLRAHGASERYKHTQHGLNSRLDEVQAAVLRIKLPRVRAWNSRRRSIAAQYRRELSGMKFQTITPGGEPVYHVVSIRVHESRRDALVARLRAQGIEVGVFYPQPLHLQKVFRTLGHRVGDFPNAERAAREILALPIFAEMTAAQVRLVTRACVE